MKDFFIVKYKYSLSACKKKNKLFIFIASVLMLSLSVVPDAFAISRSSTSGQQYIIPGANVTGTITTATLPGANVKGSMDNATLPGGNVTGSITTATVPGANVTGAITTATIPGENVTSAVATAKTAYSQNILKFAIEIHAYDSAYSQKNVLIEFAPVNGAPNISFDPPEIRAGTCPDLSCSVNTCYCRGGSAYGSAMAALAYIVLPPGGSATYAVHVRVWSDPGWEGNGTQYKTFTLSQLLKTCVFSLSGWSNFPYTIHREFSNVDMTCN